jgi:hypothetical protein
MISAIYVQKNGNFEQVTLCMRQKVVKLNKSTMHTHYAGQDFFILSRHEVDYSFEHAALFNFSLPPPLNRYFYPDDIVICANRESNFSSLTIKEFVEYCANVNDQFVKIKNQLAVYDVPLKEPVCEEEEFSDHEEEDFEISDEEEVEEEEEDWEEEDDGRSGNIVTQ